MVFAICIYYFLTVPASASEQLLIEDGDNLVIRNQEGVLKTWDQDQVFFHERMNKIGFRVSPTQELTPADGDCGIHAALGK